MVFRYTNAGDVNHGEDFLIYMRPASAEKDATKFLRGDGKWADVTIGTESSTVEGAM